MDLENLYQNIRRLYFPRWDANREWTAEFGNAEQLRNNTGYCDTAAKTLYFDCRSMTSMSEEGSRAFVIHEICHDVGAAFHNRAWSVRMAQAALRAEQLGEDEVAAILRSDIELYSGVGVIEEFNRENVQEYVAELYWTHGVREEPEAVRRVAKYFGHAPSKVRRDFGQDIQDELADQH